MDPLLQQWRRTSRPTQIDEQQRAALGLCLDVTELDSLGHRWGPTRQPDYRRSFFAAVHEDDDPDHTSERRHEPALIDAFTDLWDLYLQHGRDQLHTEGGTVLTSPELAAGFATADLITDQTLIEIKTAAQPETLLDKALNQILGYVLCDHDDKFQLRTACLYLSRQAKSLTVSLADLLRTATPDDSVCRKHITMVSPGRFQSSYHRILIPQRQWYYMTDRGAIRRARRTH
ncbi:hypothetical protein [Saccharopolyspora shandongensis]|uniref:hypothetical protein n=1 Tax=Saccharopolyspora shandongensis TaxID=418495 RepID=UPI0033E34AC6